MSQREIMAYLAGKIKSFLEESVSDREIEVAFSGENEKQENVILVEVLNLIRHGKRANGPRLKKKVFVSGEHKEIFVRPPLPMEIILRITPIGKNTLESLKLAGLVEQLMEDHREIDPEEYDWIGNDGESILIEPVETSGIGCARDFSIQFSIELDYREEIKRVEERKFAAVKKNDEK